MFEPLLGHFLRANVEAVFLFFLVFLMNIALFGPVEWEDFLSIRPSVHPSVRTSPPLRAQKPARQALDPASQASEPARQASEPASQASEPASQASEPAS